MLAALSGDYTLRCLHGDAGSSVTELTELAFLSDSSVDAH